VDTAANKEIVRRFFEVGVLGEPDLFDDIVAPDFVNHAAPQRQGLAGLKEVIAFSRNAQPDQRWTEQHVVAEGELVVVYGVREGTWSATEFRGIKTPAGQVAVELAHMFRVVEGKITEHWAVRDDLGMIRQLGVLPS
jgi:predicted ester cyclase